MLKLNRENTIIAIASGTLTLASYLLIQKYFSSYPKKQKGNKYYEEKAILDQYMVFNYAHADEFLTFDDLKDYENVRNCIQFPKNVALLCRDHCPDIFFDSNQPASNNSERSVLDVGCAVGRSCFEFSKLFHRVVGIDYSESFIKYCNDLVANNGEMEYQGILEGDLVQKLRVKLDSDVRLDRVKFEVGDACNLREDLGQYDLVLASNLICRLVEPKIFLNRLKALVKSRRYVILSTPFSWGSEYTPKVSGSTFILFNFIFS
jgi:SAM-dependent methyltransferase